MDNTRQAINKSSERKPGADQADYMYVSTTLAALNVLPDKVIANVPDPIGSSNLLKVHKVLCQSDLYQRMSSQALQSGDITLASGGVKIPQWDSEKRTITIPENEGAAEDVRDILFEMTNAYQHPQHSANLKALMIKEIDVVTYAVRFEAIEFNGLLLFCRIRQELPPKAREAILLPTELEQAVAQRDFGLYLSIVRENGHTQAIIERAMKY